MAEKSILTNLRLPESLDQRARVIARRTGVSRNDLIKVIVASALAADLNHPRALTPEQLDAAARAVALLTGSSTPQEDSP
jgi:hypothetical protein